MCRVVIAAAAWPARAHTKLFKTTTKIIAMKRHVDTVAILVLSIKRICSSTFFC
jgi:hypothetical protein